MENSVKGSMKTGYCAKPLKSLQTTDQTKINNYTHKFNPFQTSEFMDTLKPSESRNQSKINDSAKTSQSIRIIKSTQKYNSTYTRNLAKISNSNINRGFAQKNNPPKIIESIGIERNSINRNGILQEQAKRFGKNGIFGAIDTNPFRINDCEYYSRKELENRKRTADKLQENKNLMDNIFTSTKLNKRSYDCEHEFNNSLRIMNGPPALRMIDNNSTVKKNEDSIKDIAKMKDSINMFKDMGIIKTGMGDMNQKSQKITTSENIAENQANNNMNSQIKNIASNRTHNQFENIANSHASKPSINDNMTQLTEIIDRINSINEYLEQINFKKDDMHKLADLKIAENSYVNRSDNANTNNYVDKNKEKNYMINIDDSTNKQNDTNSHQNYINGLHKPINGPNINIDGSRTPVNSPRNNTQQIDMNKMYIHNNSPYINTDKQNIQINTSNAHINGEYNYLQGNYTDIIEKNDQSGELGVDQCIELMQKLAMNLNNFPQLFDGENVNYTNPNSAINCNQIDSMPFNDNQTSMTQTSINRMDQIWINDVTNPQSCQIISSDMNCSNPDKMNIDNGEICKCMCRICGRFNGVCTCICEICSVFDGMESGNCQKIEKKNNLGANGDFASEIIDQLMSYKFANDNKDPNSNNQLKDGINNNQNYGILIDRISPDMRSQGVHDQHDFNSMTCQINGQSCLNSQKIEAMENNGHLHNLQNAPISPDIPTCQEMTNMQAILNKFNNQELLEMLDKLIENKDTLDQQKIGENVHPKSSSKTTTHRDAFVGTNIINDRQLDWWNSINKINNRASKNPVLYQQENQKLYSENINADRKSNNQIIWKNIEIRNFGNKNAEIDGKRCKSSDRVKQNNLIPMYINVVFRHMNGKYYEQYNFDNMFYEKAIKTLRKLANSQNDPIRPNIETNQQNFIKFKNFNAKDQTKYLDFNLFNREIQQNYEHSGLISEEKQPQCSALNSLINKKHYSKIECGPPFKCPDPMKNNSIIQFKRNNESTVNENINGVRNPTGNTCLTLDDFLKDILSDISDEYHQYTNIQNKNVNEVKKSPSSEEKYVNNVIESSFEGTSESGLNFSEINRSFERDVNKYMDTSFEKTSDRSFDSETTKRNISISSRASELCHELEYLILNERIYNYDISEIIYLIINQYLKDNLAFYQESKVNECIYSPELGAYLFYYRLKRDITPRRGNKKSINDYNKFITSHTNGNCENISDIYSMFGFEKKTTLNELNIIGSNEKQIHDETLKNDLHVNNFQCNKVFDRISTNGPDEWNIICIPINKKVENEIANRLEIDNRNRKSSIFKITADQLDYLHL